MRSITLFIAGVVFGTTIQATLAQAPAQPAAVRLNHVALSVPDVGQAVSYYGEKFGFREVVRNTNPQGQVMSAYIQINRDTFIELQQANAQRPAGINHFGFETPDIKAAVAAYRGRGLTVTEPMGPSAFTGGILANVTDATAGRIELSEQPPDGKLRKATDSWK